jgi:hypothetical protein
VSELDTNDQPCRRGRPKGSKNKPKRKLSKKEKLKKIEPSNDEGLDSHLDYNKFVETGYNISTEAIINAEPIDENYYYRGSKNVPVAGAQYPWTPAMVEELRRCKDDIIYFAENFFYVVTLNEGKRKIKLYEPQKRVLRSLVDHRFVSLLSCRQSGKTTLLTIFVLWMICFNGDYRAAIVANKETTAINIFKRVRMAYEQLPNYIKPGVKDYAKTGMTLGNDSSIIVSTTTTTSIRGDTLNAICLDEAAFIESHLLEEFWASVIPAISSGKRSKILMVSTPNGVGNKFYEIFSGAESGKLKEWKSERIDWWEVPGRDENWKQTMIEILGSEEKFLQEFNNTFLDTASCAVGAAVIERFKQEKKPAIWSSEDGEYHVFEAPSKDKLYVIGVDVGEGIGRAASVAQILDVTDLQEIKQVAVYGSSTIEPYHFANKLNVIGHSWGLAPMLIERNNCGAQVIDALYHQHRYEKIVSYNKISEMDKYNRTRNLGVLSHTNIKFDGVQNMRYWVNHLQVVKVNDPQTITEFETFVRQPNGIYKKRNDNFYDDRIMSLVWALFILETEICQQYFTIAQFDNQYKPLKISSNGYWEVVDENYKLRDLARDNNAIINLPDQTFLDTFDESQPSGLGFTESDLFATQDNKYGLDMEDLMNMGYQPFLSNE